MHEEPGLVLAEEPGKDQYQIEAEYGAKNSYPVKLAELLGYTPHNHAISGGSNDAMFRIFLEQVDNFDLVIACWTGKDRGELYHTEHKYWIPINVGNSDSFTKTPNDVLLQGRNVLTKVKDHELYENYGKQWLTYEGNEQRAYNNKLKNILALNAIARSKGIKVINLDSFQGIYHQFSWPEEIYFPGDSHRDEFCNWCESKKFPTESRGHFFQPAHQKYAEHVFEKIKNKGAF